MPDVCGQDTEGEHRAAGAEDNLRSLAVKRRKERSSWREAQKDGLFLQRREGFQHVCTVRMGPGMREGRKIQVQEDIIKRMRFSRRKKKWIPELQWRMNIRQVRLFFFFLHCKRREGWEGGSRQSWACSPVISG